MNSQKMSVASSSWIHVQISEESFIRIPKKIFKRIHLKFVKKPKKILLNIPGRIHAETNQQKPLVKFPKENFEKKFRRVPGFHSWTWWMTFQRNSWGNLWMYFWRNPRANKYLEKRKNKNIPRQIFRKFSNEFM